MDVLVWQVAANNGWMRHNTSFWLQTRTSLRRKKQNLKTSRTAINRRVQVPIIHALTVFDGQSFSCKSGHCCTKNGRTLLDALVAQRMLKVAIGEDDPTQSLWTYGTTKSYPLRFQHRVLNLSRRPKDMSFGVLNLQHQNESLFLID